MSVRQNPTCIIVIDSLTGVEVARLSLAVYNMGTIERCLTDLFYKYCVDNEHGLLIKIGNTDM